MHTATKHEQKTTLKIKEQERKSGINYKVIVAKVTKAGNDLVGSKLAEKGFYLKHNSYFHHNNKCCAKLLLDKT